MKDYSKIDTSQFLQFIFHPRKEEKNSPYNGCVDLDIEVEQNVSLGCRFFPADKKAPTIIFFHGNGETVRDYDEIGLQYTNYGINYFVLTYRGYGWSSGTPTVAAFMKDAIKAAYYVRSYCKKNGYNEKLFVMGRSLGSAAAIEVAVNSFLSPSGLIIESGFAESEPLAKRLGVSIPGELAESDGFDNVEKMKKVTMPTLIIHGQRDELIPVFEAERLMSHCGARSKQMQIVPGADHNSVISTAGDLYFQEIKKYLDTITGASSWRRRRKAFKKEHNS